MKQLLTLLTVFAVIFAFNGIGSADCGSDHGKMGQSKEKAQKMVSAETEKMNKKDIVDMAVSAGSFKTLVAAVKAAGLVEALKGEGPFTVFAPTDEAFAKLPEGTVEALLKDKEKLASILTYHVVSGAVKAEDVVKLKKAETLNGQNVKITVDEGAVMVDNANVITTDILCSNGVIHVIDKVILPDTGKK